MAVIQAKWILIDGELVKYTDAKIHLRSPAVRYGASVFEGIRGYWNKEREEIYLFRLAAHWRRFQDSMKMIRVTPSTKVPDFTQALIKQIRACEYREDIHGIVTAYIDGDDALPMFVPRKPQASPTVPASISVLMYPFGRQTEAEGWHATVSSWARISDRSQPPRIKAGANYNNTRLAKLQSELDGYDTAIQLTQEGKVCEGLSATIFIVRHGEVITPPVTDGILEGITRETLIKMLPARLGIPAVERSIDRTELYVADEIFFCGSGVEIVPILSVDRHPIGDGHTGPLTTRIRDAYFELVRGEVPDTEGWLTPVYAAVGAKR